MILAIVLFLAVLAALFALAVFCFGVAFLGVNKLRSSRVQFMDGKDWRRVRSRLNESHEETQVAVATDHLRGLLADE